MAETVGSLADKLSIVELKIYHMREQTEREEATEDFRVQCRGRLAAVGDGMAGHVACRLRRVPRFPEQLNGIGGVLRSLRRVV